MQHPSWTRDETDVLFQLCHQFDLRFIVIHDRFIEHMERQQPQPSMAVLSPSSSTKQDMDIDTKALSTSSQPPITPSNTNPTSSALSLSTSTSTPTPATISNLPESSASLQQPTLIHMSSSNSLVTCETKEQNEAQPSTTETKSTLSTQVENCC